MSKRGAPRKVNFTDSVSDAWWYRSKHSSVHIKLKPVIREINIGNGVSIKLLIEIPQINLDLT